MATIKSEGESKINPKAAMKTELIVEHMMRFLNLNDLKRIRLVNKLWSCEGGKEMLLKSCFRIPSKFHKKNKAEQEIDKKILLNFLHPNQSETLNGQNEEKKESRCRKVLNLRIYNPLDIEILQAIKFPYEFVQHLCFPPLSEISQRRNQRNLYKLGLKEILPSFKSLISLEIVKSGETKKTSRISPSLEEIAIFCEAGKLDLVTFFEFKVDGKLKMPVREQVEVLEMFAAQNPRLDYIVIGYRIRKMAAQDPALFSRFIGALNHVLISSRESLTVLEMTDSLGDVAELVIPALENLKSLVILLPSIQRMRTPAFSALEESSFTSLKRVSIGILTWDWTFRKLLRQVDPSAMSVLLPGLNPDIKFSPHLVESQRGNRNRLLIFSSDSTSESDLNLDSASKSKSKNLVVDAKALLQHVDDHSLTVDRFRFVLYYLFCSIVIGPLLTAWLSPQQPGLQLLEETAQLGDETLILLNRTLGSLNASGVLELKMNFERLEKNAKALEKFPLTLEKGVLVTQILMANVQYVLKFHQGFTLSHRHVNRLREELGMQNPVLDNMFRRMAWRSSRSLLEILKENDKNMALLEALGELLDNIVHEPRIPALYCEAEDLTLKIPPRFICPLLLNSSTTAADAAFVKDALFYKIYQPIKCQE